MINNGDVMGQYLLQSQTNSSDKPGVNRDETSTRLGVIAVTSDTSGCGFYRMHQPYNILKRKKLINLSVDMLTNQFDAHVVVLQRSYSQDVQSFVKHVKANRETFPKFVLELDDDVLSVPEENTFYDHYQTNRAGYIEMMNLVDAITVSTEGLAAVVRKHSPVPVFVLPNRVPSRLFSSFTSRPIPSNDGLRLFWQGSPTHKADLQVAVPGVTQYLNENPGASLTFLGTDYSDLFPKHLRVQMAYLGWVEGVEKYHEVLAEVSGQQDVMLAPLQSNTFNDSKSNLRLLEAAAVGLPVICSDSGPYSGITPGAKKAHDDDWYSALKAVSLELSDLSSEGRSWVYENHLAPRGADLYVEMLHKVMNLA